MPLSIDVNLPRSYAPHFPDRCVVCGADDPSSNVRIIGGAIGWWTWILWIGGIPKIVKAPACRWCGWKLHLLRFTSVVTFCVVGFAALWFLWPLVWDFVPRSLRKLAMGCLALLSVSPLIVYEVFFAPKPFDVTVYSDSVDYEFVDEEYAVDFAMNNLDAEWVKVNGETIKQD